MVALPILSDRHAACSAGLITAGCSMESLRSMHPGPLSAAQYFRYHILLATCGRSPVLSGQTLHPHVGDDADNCPSAGLLPAPESGGREKAIDDTRSVSVPKSDDLGTPSFRPESDRLGKPTGETVE